MQVYDHSISVRDALQIYFSRYHFDNGGYDLKWFRIKLGKLYIPLPNTKARIAAVKIHDIHHLLTGYEATLKGEAEIAGWEIASGCGKYYASWILNFGAFFYGIFFFPRSLYKAFMRGRRSRSNLYHNVHYDNELLDTSLGELSAKIGIDLSFKNPLKDAFNFITYAIMILASYFVFLFAICIGFKYLLHLIF